MEILTKFYGINHTQAIISSLSRPPLQTTVRINPNLTTLEEASKYLQEECSKQDSSFIVKPHPNVKDVLVIPVTGPHNPEIQSRAIIVDRLCGEAVMRGAHVYIPGVFACTANVGKDDLVSVFSLLEGSITRGFIFTKEDINKYKERKNNWFFLGNGISKLSRSELFSHEGNNKGIAIEMKNSIWKTPSMNDIIKPSIFLQNLPSIIVTQELDPQPGESIIDMCAAPGGKTSHIAFLMNGKGKLISCDKSKSKVNKMKEFLHSLNITFPQLLKLDTSSELFFSENSEKGIYPESFDRVLLDAPCSGLGQRPRLDLQISTESLESIASYQQRFFKNAVSLLKPNGILVYSTCTISPLENERNVRYALDNFPLQLIELKTTLGSEGLVEESLLKSDEAKKVRFFDPSDDSLQTIGFFIAKFQKISNN